MAVLVKVCLEYEPQTMNEELEYNSDAEERDLKCELVPN